MISNLEARLHSKLEELQSKYVGVLKSLVQIPSILGEEGKAQSLIARLLGELGATVHYVQVNPDELRTFSSFNPTPQSYFNRPCVVGVLKGIGGGKSLILNTHI